MATSPGVRPCRLPMARRRSTSSRLRVRSGSWKLGVRWRKSSGGIAAMRSRVILPVSRPLFIGEFGVPGALTPESSAQFRAWLDAIDLHRVPLAALWVYDFDGQAADWNVTFDNARSALLRLVAERNSAWRTAHQTKAAPQ